MNSGRWEQIEKLYHAALEIEAGNRAAFLDEACAGNKELRAEVESLLAYVTRAENFIESPAIEVAAELLLKRQVEPGSTIGHYKIVSLIGTGGMGEVYLAEDPKLGRKIALKLLPGEFTQAEERVRRFKQEARAASALNHPNIITIFEIGQVDNAHYIATEYIEGQTLRQHINNARIELAEVLDIACQIASALTAAHDAGITHRDIKPENIMLRPDGYVKVLDFGIAKLTEASSPAIDTEAPTALAAGTRTGVVLGTAGYMSPEQARGQKTDARTDLFSLGVVLYEMVAGGAPFTGPTSADVVAAILLHEPAPITNLVSEAPERIDWIVGKALRKSRDERYQTAKELLSDLRSLKQRLVFEEELKRSMAGGTVNVGSASGTDPARANAALTSIAEHRSHQIIDSVAVLPFANTFADPGMEYFCDGVSESIINTLSEISDLHVMAWSTVSHYKNRQVDPREAGRDLGVRAVLTGRFIELGENLIFKTELVDAANGSHLWGDSCSCKPSDIFNIEEEICKGISEKLLFRLTTEEKRRLSKRHTDDVEAYHSYLKGRYFWNKRTDDSLRQGLECFRQAIERDPCYALAYVGLADSYGVLGSFGIATMSPGEAFPKAREAVAKALEIDDTLAEAHVSLAYILANYYWDWPAAEREFNRTFQLKSDYPTAHHWYGFVYLVATGKLDEAIREAKRAHELDPLSLPISANVGFLLYLARQYDQAVDQFQKTLEMDQNFAYTRWELALAYEQKSMYSEAIAEFKKAGDLSGRSTLPLALLGHAYAVSGKIDDALAVIDNLKKLSKQNYVSPYRVAAIYAGLGDHEQAFEWLERAYEERDSWMIWLHVDPVLEVIQSDKRFTSLLDRIGVGGRSRKGKPLPRTAAVPARSRRKQPRKAIRSLAILPLSNKSDDPGMEYLSDGITESIINTLSQLPKVRVVARSTVFRYRGENADPQKVGRELGVHAVLTGRVRQLGDRLAIAAELIDVASDSHLWGEHYNRDASDIFEVQEEIAKEIAETLRLRLNREQKGRITKRYTGNTEAYHLYLKGRYHWHKFTAEGLLKARECFVNAIDLDPSYALAYAGLSDTYNSLGAWEAETLPPREAMPKAKAAAMKALEIDDTLAAAHASLAYVQMYYDWDWPGAGKEFERAIELNPNYANAHHWYSHYLMVKNRVEDSLRMSKRALELDPLAVVMNVHMAWHYYYARQYDLAIDECRKTLELESNSFHARYFLGWAYERLGKYQEAIEEFQKAITLSGHRTAIKASLAHTYALSGRTSEARNILNELMDLSAREYVSAFDLAIIHAGLAERDRVFEWLDKAYENRSGWLVYVDIEPRLDSLHSDPRFLDLLQRIGLSGSKWTRYSTGSDRKRDLLG